MQLCQHNPLQTLTVSHLHFCCTISAISGFAAPSLSYFSQIFLSYISYLRPSLNNLILFRFLSFTIMALVIPTAFTLTTGIFGALNAIGGILISMRKCYKGYTKIRNLLDRSAASLASFREQVKQAAVYVVLGAVPMESFCSIVVRCNEIEEELQGMDVKSKKKRRCIYNFFSATEKCAALEAISGKLAKMETDIRQMIPLAGLTVQVSAMLEMMVPLLEATATTTADNGNIYEHRRLLSNVRQVYGTKIMSSELNRMTTGTGGTTSAYYFVMGMTYYSGIKVKKDYKRSLGYFHEAVRHGNTESYLYIAMQYEKGHGVKWDEKKALGYYEKGANHGDVDCQSEIAYSLARGNGVEKDKRKGIETLKCAAGSGSVAAQYKLGVCFQCGWGTDADDVRAVEYFRRAAEAGHVDALISYAFCWTYGRGVKRNCKYGIVLLRTAANVGSLKAMFLLNLIYRSGLFGVEKDLNESFRWSSEAAKRNDAGAMCTVGECLIEGKGVVRNVPKGLQYLIDAAAAGYVYAFSLLAGYYRRGTGVKINKKKSLELYHRAAEPNWFTGHFELGEMYKSGEGTRVDYEKAIHHFSIHLKVFGELCFSHRVHWELATIFEGAKGYTNSNRALYHFRMFADMKLRDEAANRRVAEYFVRATPPRKMRFTHQEFQLSLDTIRKVHSRRERDGSFNIFSSGRPWRINSYPQTALLTSPESNAPRPIVESHPHTPSTHKEAPAAASPCNAETEPSREPVETSSIERAPTPTTTMLLFSLSFLSLFTFAFFFFFSFVNSYM